jgi:uncharacterized protein YigA (DUF484 family)
VLYRVQQVTAALYRVQQVTEVLYRVQKVTEALYRVHKVTALLYRVQQDTAVLYRVQQVTEVLYRVQQVTAALYRVHQVTAVLYRVQQVTAALYRTAILTPVGVGHTTNHAPSQHACRAAKLNFIAGYKPNISHVNKTPTTQICRTGRPFNWNVRFTSSTPGNASKRTASAVLILRRTEQP